MRRGTGCADAQPQAKRKTLTGKTVQGRASAQAPSATPDVELDADEV